MNALIVISGHGLEPEHTNGASSRLAAWRTVLPEIIIARSPSDLPQGHGECLLCVDLTGANFTTILGSWRNLRRFKPVAYLQDSQARYFASQIMFRVKSGNPSIFLSMINYVRGYSREFATKILFRKVGYISEVDASYVWKKSHTLTVLGPMLNVTKLGRPIKQIMTIGMIANFQYPPNLDGVAFLLNSNVFLSFLKTNKIQIRLIGHKSSQLAGILKNKFGDVVDSENSMPFSDLSSALSTVDLTINPAHYGAGVKNKIIESTNEGILSLSYCGVRSEFPYSYPLVHYYDNPAQLTQKLQELCDECRLSPGTRGGIYLLRTYMRDFFK
jgi:hypothetical protein